MSRSLVTLMTVVSPSQDFITRYVTNIECIRRAISMKEGGGGGGGGGKSEGKGRGGGSEDGNDEVDDYANERAIRAITHEIEGIISEK